MKCTNLTSAKVGQVLGIKTRIGKIVRKKFKESLYLAIVPAIIGGSFLIWSTYLSNSPDSNEKTVQSIAYSSGNNSSAVSEVVTNNIDARIVASDNAIVITGNDSNITIESMKNSHTYNSSAGKLKGVQEAQLKDIKYKIDIIVDKQKSKLGRGWDYPLVQPDPFVCIGKNRDEKKKCYDFNQPDWQVCQNKFQCSLSMYFTPTDEVVVWLYDRDDGNLAAGSHDEIGSSECEVGIKCRLENSQSNLNSGSVLIERVGE